MLVLCPNHHADFDNGVIAVDPETEALVHPFDEVRDQLRLENGHTISQEYHRYHLEELAVEETTSLLG